MEDIIGVVESYNEYIENVANGSIQLAEYLRQDKIEEAMKMILDFSEGMGWLVHAEELLTQSNVTVDLNISKIHEFLNEINNGLEMQDYVLVADMFEYEIAPFFQALKPIEGPKN